MTQIFGILEASHNSQGRSSPADHVWGALGEVMRELQQQCERMDLPMSLASLRRLREIIEDADSQQFSYYTLISPIRELHTRVVDELESRLFLAVPPREARLYQVPREGWADVPDKFPSAAFDIEEASKCLALGRYTASVFHLMRVLETAFRAVAAALQTSAHSPTWNAYLTAFRSAIDLRYPDKDKSTQNQRMRTFYAGAEAQLRVVKDAWRNPTMHRVDTVYTEAMALDIHSAVGAFMRLLTTELTEAP